MFSASKTAGPSGYNINNSLRFRASASATLSRTPASTTNQNTFTFSFWMKKGKLGASSRFYVGRTSTNFPAFGLQIDDSLMCDQYTNGGVLQLQLITTQVFRDPSAWYHIVVAFDTTQATSSNRIKFYVNGSQITAFSTATYPSQNLAINVNTTNTQYIGGDPAQPFYWDGYMAEFNFIDGQALTPSSFGSTNATTGVWQPAKYTGSYGTNGFYLPFSDIATTSGSNAGLGKDFSGNSNYWTTNNISVTAGTTYDAMTDSPTLTSATVANYCTLNPLESFTSPVPQQANLYFNGADYSQIKGTFWVSTGKWYFEWVSVSGSLPAYVGVSNVSITSNTNVTTSGISWYGHNNSYYKNFTGTSLVSASAISIGDIIAVAFDCDAGTVAYYKNNTLVHTDTTLTPNQLVAPTLIATFSGGGWSPAAFNFGQRPFSYTPPSGYKALNTFNLPTSTVVKGNTVMDATLYTGTGSTQSITNAGAFKPDLVWWKSRSGTGNHGWTDSIRGVTKQLSSSDITVAEQTTSDGITAFNANGWSIGSGATGYSINGSTVTYVGWQWQAGQGSTSTNTAGSITSTVSVNTTAGFSVVTYTANSNSTVGHGLGVAPKVVIMKSRTVNNGWLFGSDVIGWTNFLWLNLTNASTANSTVWNNTAPTSSVFTLGSGVSTANYGDMVAYCWAEIAGFSKFGSYTGNGSADGPFVYTGFRPKFVVIKVSSTTNSWEIFDTSRDTYNASGLRLFAESSSAEVDSRPYIDILSNGFKLRSTGTGINGSGSTYIFMAFAENPFKNALAR